MWESSDMSNFFPNISQLELTVDPSLLQRYAMAWKSKRIYFMKNVLLQTTQFWQFDYIVNCIILADYQCASV